MRICHNLEADLTANVQMNWRAWLDQRSHSYLEDVENIRIVDEIEYDVAFTRSLGVKSYTLVVAIELCSDDVRVRKLDSNLDAFDTVGKQMSMFILEFDRHFQRRAERKAKCFIEVMLVSRR